MVLTTGAWIDDPNMLLLHLEAGVDLAQFRRAELDLPQRPCPASLWQGDRRFGPEAMVIQNLSGSGASLANRGRQ